MGACTRLPFWKNAMRWHGCQASPIELLLLLQFDGDAVGRGVCVAPDRFSQLGEIVMRNPKQFFLVEHKGGIALRCCFFRFYVAACGFAAYCVLKNSK